MRHRFCNNAAVFKDEQQHYGKWTIDAVGMPCFDLAPEKALYAVNSPFNHLIGTGRISAIVNRWGNVNLFTTEGGFLWINSPDSPVARSSIYLMMEHNGEWISLLHGELSIKRKIRIGLGYIEYWGEVVIGESYIQIVQQVFSSPHNEKFLCARFVLTHLHGPEWAGRIEIRSDVAEAKGWSRPHSVENRPFWGRPGCAVFPHLDEQVGNVFLMADEEWEAFSVRSSLRLGRNANFHREKKTIVNCATGYGEIPFSFPTFIEAQNDWFLRIKPFAIEAPEPWMAQECLWNAGQMLSFAAYDNSVGEHYLSLGGYGWPGFGVREASETSIVLAETDWDLAASSLRFVAKTQLASGDVPKSHNMRRDRISKEFDSDTELWFLLGCGECISATGNLEFLDEECSFWNNGMGTMWEHIRRAFYWVRDEIGRGEHGLILIREGDWNDYLSLMGAGGRGESVMNSGIACRALDHIANLARHRHDTNFAREVGKYLREIREAVHGAFVDDWFLRGYTDHGKPVGVASDDRLFLNAQSWAVLGRCGTLQQRRKALAKALEKCHTDIGLTLMSRPYSSPAPDDISRCALPAGEGENAGIWPQALYWFVWALAEEGMAEEALAEWKCGTLRHHARQFPHVPFGIFNGPDCFSSKWSGNREGWTQIQLIDREHFIPMLPMVAWQGFALRQINRSVREHAANPPVVSVIASSKSLTSAS